MLKGLFYIAGSYATQALENGSLNCTRYGEQRVDLLAVLEYLAYSMFGVG